MNTLLQWTCKAAFATGTVLTLLAIVAINNADASTPAPADDEHNHVEISALAVQYANLTDSNRDLRAQLDALAAQPAEPPLLSALSAAPINQAPPWRLSAGVVGDSNNAALALRLSSCGLSLGVQRDTEHRTLLSIGGFIGRGSCN